MEKSMQHLCIEFFKKKKYVEPKKILLQYFPTIQNSQNPLHQLIFQEGCYIENNMQYVFQKLKRDLFFCERKHFKDNIFVLKK